MIGGTNWAFRCRLSLEKILHILSLGDLCPYMVLYDQPRVSLKLLTLQRLTRRSTSCLYQIQGAR